MKKNTRVDRLRYEASCAKILEKILKHKDWPLDCTPFTATKKLEWLFIEVIPNPNERANKIRLLFQGKFAQGDDVYLRMIWEAQSRRKELATKITSKYNPEIQELRNQYQIKKTR